MGTDADDAVGAGAGSDAGRDAVSGAGGGAGGASAETGPATGGAAGHAGRRAGEEADPAGMRPGGAAGQSGRRLGEVAALVSAVTAVAGLLLAVFGLPGALGSPGAKTPAPGAAPAAPAPVSSTPARTPTGAEPAPSGTGTTPEPSRGAGSSAAPPGPLPDGWHRIQEPALTLTGAVPDGWPAEAGDELRRIRTSPDGAHVLGYKRDSFHGSTAAAAADGQLAWYRTTAESKMEGLEAGRTAATHEGRDAVVLTLDYHWSGQSGPRRRIELFVTGDGGQVYQLLVDSDATSGRPAEQARLFDTARAQLRTDVR